MKRIFAFLLFPAMAAASPFIVSDPYPLTGAQPTHCEAVEGTTTYRNAVATDAQGRVYCKIDIAGIATGSHQLQVKATSTAPGVDASASVPFVFTIERLVDPASIRLVR